MKKHLSLIFASLFLILIYFLLQKESLLSVEQMKNCMIVTIALGATCMIILEYLKRKATNQKKDLIKFVSGSMLMTVVFLGLLVVYLLENEQTNNYYLFCILINYIVFKALLVRGIMNI